MTAMSSSLLAQAATPSAGDARAEVVDVLARTYSRTLHYSVDADGDSMLGARPDLAVCKGVYIVHLFQVSTPDTVTADQARTLWGPLAHQAAVAGATLWLLVPEDLLEAARCIVRTMQIAARLATYQQSCSGGMQFRWT